MSSSDSISSFSAARIISTAVQDDEDDELKKAAEGLSTSTDPTDPNTSPTAAALATVTNSDPASSDNSTVQALGGQSSFASASDSSSQWDAFAQTGTNAPDQPQLASDAPTTTIDALTPNNRFIRV